MWPSWQEPVVSLDLVAGSECSSKKCDSQEGKGKIEASLSRKTCATAGDESTGVRPMVLTASTTIPVGEGWSYELKWDGFRAIATIDAGELDLRSRHGTDMRPWFPELVGLVDHVGRDVVLDGEVVALDANGRPDFYALRRSRPTFVAFDILKLDGRDLTSLRLRDRRRILAEVVADKLPLVLRSRPFDDGAALFKEAERLRLEGMLRSSTSLTDQESDRKAGSRLRRRPAGRRR